MTVNTESSRAGSASSINRSEKEPILQIEKGIAGTRAMLASRRNSYHFQPSIPRLNDCLSVAPWPMRQASCSLFRWSFSGPSSQRLKNDWRINQST